MTYWNIFWPIYCLVSGLALGFAFTRNHYKKRIIKLEDELTLEKGGVEMLLRERKSKQQ